MAHRFSARPGVAVTVALACLPAWASAESASPEELIEALKSGGHVLYIRHAQTEADYADQVTAEMGNCATQRVLSETGWEQAKRIGAAMDAAGVPVGEVISSEYCRAWQTAELAFGSHEKNAALNFVRAETYTDEQIALMRDRVLPLLTAPVDSGNRVIVGHDDPFEAATGIYPEPQGVAYVLKRADDGTMTVLGSIGPDAWPE